MKTALLLVACVGLGLFGAHSFIEERRSIQEITAPADVAEVQTKVALYPLDTEEDLIGAGVVRQAEYEATLKEMGGHYKRAEALAVENAALKEKLDNMEKARTESIGGWASEKVEIVSHLQKTEAERNQWVAEAERWMNLSKANYEAATSWEIVARNYERGYKALASQTPANSMTQTVNTQPIPPARPPLPPFPTTIDIEKNGRWATDSAGNTYHIDHLGRRTTLTR